MDVFIVSKDFLGAKNLLREVVDACTSLAPLDPAFEVVVTATTVTFANGRRIVALPCRPETIRSCTGAVICDEVAFWRLMEEVWAAAKVVAGQTLGADHGYPMMLITTPWDSGSLACRLFTDGGIPFADWDNGQFESESGFPFIRHRTDVYQAKADGFPIDIPAVRDELGIPELFATEFECRWSHGGDSFFPLSKLRDCEEDELPDGWQDAPLYIGIDVGGGKGRDNTAIVCWRAVGNDCWMTGVTAFNRKEPVDQWDEVEAIIRRDATVNTRIIVAVDAGFEGTPLMSELRRRFRDWKRLRFVGLSMGVQQQERYAKATRLALEHGRIKLYTGTDAGGEEHGVRALMLEMSQLKTKPGAGGHLTFSTPRDPSKGHCDRAWAAMFGLSRIAGAGTSEGMTGGGITIPPIVEYHSPLNF